MFAKRTLAVVALGSYIVAASGCGVLLYPERQGQSGGRIDPVVAILDGIGLLLYLIPGLVAFAIDFHQGTIYLPGGITAEGAGDGQPVAIKVNGEMTEENIEAALQQALGRPVDISGPNVQAQRIDFEQLQLLQGYAGLQGRTLI